MRQQAAGLVIWIPPGIIYTAAALAISGLWIVQSGRKPNLKDNRSSAPALRIE